MDGSVDAMMMYVTSALGYGIPYIQLPDEIDLSSPALAANYRVASYTNPRGQSFQGTPALYSITIPQSATNLEGAVAFVAHLFSAQGHAALSHHGFTPTGALLGGELSAVPTELQSLVLATYS